MTAQQRNANPAHRPDQALEDLYAIMRDGTVGMRVRLNAATNACRLEPLALTGQAPPPAVRFLRNIVNFKHEGKSYSADWRRMAATSLGYWERRSKQATLAFNVTDNTEQTNTWRRVLNGTMRYTLAKNRQWPDDRHNLITPNDTAFERPVYDPQLALNAFLLSGERQQKGRRKTAIDEPDKPTIANEQHRRDILADVATITPQLSPAMPQATAHTAAIQDMPPHTEVPPTRH